MSQKQVASLKGKNWKINIFCLKQLYYATVFVSRLKGVTRRYKKQYLAESAAYDLLSEMLKVKV